MTQSTPTCLWNDSASIQELTYSIEHGAVGATCNPVIVLEVLKKEMGLWRDYIEELIHRMPTATEDQIAWKMVEAISTKAALLLLPVFEQHQGKNGRLSVQTDPRFYRDSDAIVKQAVHFGELAPNIIVKIPVTRAGLPAIEEATHRGVSINATVSFTLPQAIAVAEAVERGLKRRESVPRIDKPVEPKVVDALSKKFIDFGRAFAEGGLSIEEFDSFGPTRRTLRQFVAGCGELGAIIRDFMLPEW